MSLQGRAELEGASGYEAHLPQQPWLLRGLCGSGAPSGAGPAASIPGMASAGMALACLGSPAPRPQGAPSLLRCPIFPAPTCPPPSLSLSFFPAPFLSLRGTLVWKRLQKLCSSAPSVSPSLRLQGPSLSVGSCGRGM